MGVSDRAGRCTAASIVLAFVLVALIGCAPPSDGPSAPVRRQVLWVDGSGAALRRTVPSPYADVDEWISALRSQAVQAAIAGDRELAEALTAQADDLQLRLDVSHDADHVRARTRAAFVTCPSVRAG